ncbi:MAG: hypothetical protein ACI9UK_001174 [Candidatus Krumholzibacteriia bacterium]|jgi:hypothetical protein
MNRIVIVLMASACALATLQVLGFEFSYQFFSSDESVTHHTAAGLQAPLVVGRCCWRAIAGTL